MHSLLQEQNLKNDYKNLILCKKLRTLEFNKQKNMHNNTNIMSALSR